MGLLEKAQEKKQKQEEIDNEVLLQEKAEFSQERDNTKKDLQENLTEEKKFKNYHFKKLNGTKFKKEIIEEKRGFGWKGLGTRRIVYYNDINDYLYEVTEPVLNESEKVIKKELSHLFKMLADVDISKMDMIGKEKYLEETLEQVIIDNDIKFYPKENNKTEKSRFNLINLKTEKKNIDKPLPKISINEHIEEKLSKNEKDLLIEKSKEKIFYHLFREFLGYGRIDVLMHDEGIEDISCDGPNIPIFLYHKKFDEITTNIIFNESDELDSFVVRLSQICGKQISIYSPIVDGKLPDGSRLQATLAKTVTNGSTYTIRRFRENPLTPIDLIKFKSLSIEMAAYFWICIEKGASILFCGGTASGKTTALNALSLFIPSSHKIISIEDTREVSLPHINWIAGTTRQGFSSSEENKTGKDIDMFDLIRAALRQRPKVIIVGEVRGKEAYSLFQAMATGHTSYATVHASTIHTLIQRLENPPISLPRALLTSLDIIVFQNAVEIDGTTVRRMTSVTEIIKLDPDTNQLIFMEPHKWMSKTDDRFDSSGSSKILNNIKLQNDWNEKQLNNELMNRISILNWMIHNNIRDYKEVGKIVSEYKKNPEGILDRISMEMKD
jgi:flagellar protein FlaI